MIPRMFANTYMFPQVITKSCALPQLQGETFLGNHNGGNNCRLLIVATLPLAKSSSYLVVGQGFVDNPDATLW